MGAIPLASAASLAGVLEGASVTNADAIDDASKKLAAAAYPFLQEIPWNSDVYAVLRKASPFQVLKAVDKALILGAAMDPDALKNGVLAHMKAVDRIDPRGVTTIADFEAIIRT